MKDAFRALSAGKGSFTDRLEGRRRASSRGSVPNATFGTFNVANGPLAASTPRAVLERARPEPVVAAKLSAGP
ncbi:hypothetical protein GCM10023192_53380 [Amycolatopsis samaneae]